jgi:DNA sulfur modification protein DndD
MLLLRRIRLVNFGPFKDRQEIRFQESGVTIVYGENMRGKTSLLNALRFAFLGTVIGRGEKSISLHQVGNWESFVEGNFGFTVSLDFESNGEEYSLTREWKPRPGVDCPQVDSDYELVTFLKQGDAILGPDKRDSLLTRLMPAQVARFFLFDGELLQQYEELLRDESRMGEEIKQAIERILGLPVLQNARVHLRKLHKEAQTQESKAAQRDQRTREIGNLQEQLISERGEHEKEVEHLQEELTSAQADKVSKESELRKTERLRVLLDEKDGIRAALATTRDRISEQKSRLQVHMKDAWVDVLESRIDGLRTELTASLSAEREKDRNSFALATQKGLAIESIDKDSCCTCERSLDEGALAVLREKAAAADVQGGSEDAIAQLASQIRSLDRVRIQHVLPAAREIISSIESMEMEILTKQDRLVEIEDQTRDIDESEQRRMSAEYDRAVGEIEILKRGIAGEKSKLVEIDANLGKLQEQLTRIGGEDVSQERRRTSLYADLLALFSASVDRYRDALRDHVQRDATRLFASLTSEPDYVALNISDNYGLTIVHRDGGEIPVRSAGAEHIVALSLMGALQRNAPLRGPIVMDSPFGRLDETHTTKVIQALPSMANQVVLLAYQSELDPEAARKDLGNHLKAEYRIVRVSARHSQLRSFSEE